jgi:hypothetical protein
VPAVPPAQLLQGRRIHGRASADSLVTLAPLWGYATRPSLPHKSVGSRPRRDPQGEDLLLDIGELWSLCYLVCSAEGRATIAPQRGALFGHLSMQTQASQWLRGRTWSGSRQAAHRAEGEMASIWIFARYPRNLTIASLAVEMARDKFSKTTLAADLSLARLALPARPRRWGE